MESGGEVGEEGAFFGRVRDEVGGAVSGVRGGG